MERVSEASIVVGFPGLEGLAGVLRTVRRYFQRSTMSDEEKATLHRIVHVSSQIGGLVLSSKDRTDLDNRCDFLVGQRQFYELLELVLSSRLETTEDPKPEPPNAQSVAEHVAALIKVIGQGAAGPIVNGVQYFLAMVDATKNINPDIARAEIGEFLAKSKSHPLWFLSDPEHGVEDGRAALRGLDVLICIMAIAHAFFSEDELEPWLALALAEKWELSLYAILRFVASKPDIVISEELVPAEDRIDLDRAEEGAKKTQDRFERLLEAARKSEQSVYPPLAGLEDG